MTLMASPSRFSSSISNRVNAAHSRRGIAVVELALVLPLLLLIFVVTVDFARIFYNAQVVSDCARSTALFASNPDLSDKTTYESAVEFGLKCGESLQPPPTIEIRQITEAEIHYVEVTVTQNFRLIVPFTFSSQYPLSHKARARLYPSAVEDL